MQGLTLNHVSKGAPRAYCICHASSNPSIDVCGLHYFCVPGYIYIQDMLQSPHIEQADHLVYTIGLFMMTSSNGNIFHITGHFSGEFAGPRWIPHTKASDLRLNKRLSKQLWGWWFETLSRPLWRHRNVHIRVYISIFSHQEAELFSLETILFFFHNNRGVCKSFGSAWVPKMPNWSANISIKLYNHFYIYIKIIPN